MAPARRPAGPPCPARAGPRPRVWELSQNYCSNQPAGQRDPLLQAVKQARFATPDLTGIQRSNLDIRLSFTTLPLALYRVQWSTNLASDVWNTLSNNLSGTGGVIQITDAGALTNRSARYYRVRTPP